MKVLLGYVTSDGASGPRVAADQVCAVRYREGYCIQAWLPLLSSRIGTGAPRAQGYPTTSTHTA